MILPLELGKHPLNYYFSLEVTGYEVLLKLGTFFDDKNCMIQNRSIETMLMTTEKTLNQSLFYLPILMLLIKLVTSTCGEFTVSNLNSFKNTSINLLWSASLRTQAS